MPSLHLQATPADLTRLYGWLETEARARGLPDRVLFGMQVALEEAVMNVALHAFAPDAPGEIEVHFDTLADAATLVVEDAGPPFDPTAAAVHQRPGSLEAATPGGLGLTLLHHYCDEIDYERSGERNHLTLRFWLAGRQADAAADPVRTNQS